MQSTSFKRVQTSTIPKFARPLRLRPLHRLRRPRHLRGQRRPPCLLPAAWSPASGIMSSLKFTIYYTLLYYTTIYYTILYYTILYYTTLYYTILYYTILYYTILYYTILYYTNAILYFSILCYTMVMRALALKVSLESEETAIDSGEIFMLRCTASPLLLWCLVTRIHRTAATTRATTKVLLPVNPKP